MDMNNRELKLDTEQKNVASEVEEVTKRIQTLNIKEEELGNQIYGRAHTEYFKDKKETLELFKNSFTVLFTEKKDGPKRLCCNFRG